MNHLRFLPRSARITFCQRGLPVVIGSRLGMTAFANVAPVAVTIEPVKDLAEMEAFGAD